MNKILLIAALEEIASREGHELNGQDKLVIRTKTAMAIFDAWAEHMNDVIAKNLSAFPAPSCTLN